jgi:hypothetical protein
VPTYTTEQRLGSRLTEYVAWKPADLRDHTLIGHNGELYAVCTTSWMHEGDGEGGADLEGPPGSPKLFLAPAKGGGAPPDACRVGGATASSVASPQHAGWRAAHGRRQRWTERGRSTL